MYTLIKSIGIKQFLFYEMPALGISWFIAERLYKFGSFTLESVAFLGTWLLMSFISSKIEKLFSSNT